MTDKPNNTLQVVSRDLLERIHGWLTHIHYYRVADLADLEAALKEAPKLGGEPEVLGYRMDQASGGFVGFHRDEPVWHYLGDPKEYRVTELIDRASLAPLQAQLVQLKAITNTSMGVGDGSGKLIVHGDYDSIKAAQEIVWERDDLREQCAQLRARAIELEKDREESVAPSDCAICRDLGDQCVECEEGEFRQWADRYFAAADYRMTGAGVFIQDWMRHAYAAWCARGALECNSR